MGGGGTIQAQRKAGGVETPSVDVSHAVRREAQTDTSSPAEEGLLDLSIRGKVEVESARYVLCDGCTDGTYGACFVLDGSSKLCFDVEADGKCSPGTHTCTTQPTDEL